MGEEGRLESKPLLPWLQPLHIKGTPHTASKGSTLQEHGYYRGLFTAVRAGLRGPGNSLLWVHPQALGPKGDSQEDRSSWRASSQPAFLPGGGRVRVSFLNIPGASP